MNISMDYKYKDKTLEEYKVERLSSLNDILDYIQNKEAYELDKRYVKRELELVAKNKYYTKSEKERAINELNTYISFINSLNINGDDDIYSLACKLYIFLRIQTNAQKVINELGYKFVEFVNNGEKRIVLSDDNCVGRGLRDDDLFYLIKYELKKGSELGRIAYEIYFRNCYKRHTKYKWNSFKVIEYCMNNYDYRIYF